LYLKNSDRILAKGKVWQFN